MRCGVGVCAGGVVGGGVVGGVTGGVTWIGVQRAKKVVFSVMIVCSVSCVPPVASVHHPAKVWFVRVGFGGSASRVPPSIT